MVWFMEGEQAVGVMDLLTEEGEWAMVLVFMEGEHKDWELMIWTGDSFLELLVFFSLCFSPFSSFFFSAINVLLSDLALCKFSARLSFFMSSANSSFSLAFMVLLLSLRSSLNFTISEFCLLDDCFKI
jgi:hypothetical protein